MNKNYTITFNYDELFAIYTNIDDPLIRKLFYEKILYSSTDGEEDMNGFYFQKINEQKEHQQEK